MDNILHANDVFSYLMQLTSLLGTATSSLLQYWWLGALVGIVLCFFGARLFSASVFWGAGVLAGLWSFLLLSDLTGLLPALVIAATLGLICAFVLRSLLKAGFFIVGLVMGGIVAHAVLGDSVWVLAVMLVAGVLSVLLWRVFIMVASACWGGVLLADTLCRWGLPQLASYDYALPALYAVLGLAGLLYQAGVLRDRNRRRNLGNT